MKTFLSRAIWTLTVLFALLPLAASAQQGGYQIGENGPGTTTDNNAPPDSAAGAGPIRLARFSYVQGSVTWRPGDGAAWSPASVNLPIRQGAQVWVTNGGRAEVQFDDGSLLRLGNGAVSTLQTLYSDANGEFTEIQMNEGLSELELRGTESVYQIDTPLVSIKSEGPSKVRIGVDSSVEIAVRQGRATVEGNGTKTTLNNGDYLDLPDASAPYNVGSVPDPDSWDRFNDDRDQQLADADSNLPANIALVAGNLDSYGSWHDDARYGQVWCPRVDEAGWRPYQHGHWVWVEPFGWTWVSNEAWGWAPYHYGTWVSEPYGWGWCPGPARQYWCPAVVHFSEYNGGVAWCPLAPAEVRYPPALRLGIGGRGWSLSFSIGGAAVYYPHNAEYCEPRPFNNVTVNRVTYINNVTNVYNNNTTINRTFNTTTVNRNVYLRNAAFIPVNARNASGVTSARVEEFGGAGRYHPEAEGGAAFFRRGRSIGAPLAGNAPVAGPLAARPTRLSFTSTRTFVPGAHPAFQVQQRPVFRAPLPGRVARFAPPLPRASSPVLRSGFGITAPRPVRQRVDQPDRRFPVANPEREPSSALDPVRQPFRGNVHNNVETRRSTDVPRPADVPRRTPTAFPGVPSGDRYREAPGPDSRPFAPRPEERPQPRPVDKPKDQHDQDPAKSDARGDAKGDKTEPRRRFLRGATSPRNKLRPSPC